MQVHWKMELFAEKPFVGESVLLESLVTPRLALWGSVPKRTPVATLVYLVSLSAFEPNAMLR